MHLFTLQMMSFELELHISKNDLFLTTLWIVAKKMRF